MMFEVCGIIEIPKKEFSNFYGAKRVKQNQKQLKTIQNFLSLWDNHFFCLSIYFTLAKENIQY